MNNILDDILQASQINAIELLNFDQTTLSLIDIFKRVLYPVDLFQDSEDSSSVSSLVHLCSSNIIRDDEFCTRKYLSLPVKVYDSLMAFAIDKDFHRSIGTLMSRWPRSVFSVAKIIPNALRNWNNLINDQSRLECLSKATRKYARCLITFLDYVKHGSKSPLRVLDLRGLPMGDRVMNYLIREINCLSNDDLHLDNYHILIDGVICTIDTYNGLIGHLALQKDKLHLHFNKLDLSHLSEVKSWLLLKLIDPKELVGLCIRPTLRSGNFCQLIIMRFTKLIALEIINPDYKRLRHCKPLSLRFVPNLRRLKFGAPRYYLSDVVPASDVERLEYVELRDQWLSVREEDLVYLGSVSLRIYELNLCGHCIVDRHLTHWVKLFNSLIPTLNILEVEGCLITETELPLLMDCILLLVNLRYLNLYRNPIRMQTVCRIASELCLMPKLELIRLPYMDQNLVAFVPVPDEIPPETRRKMVEEIFTTKKFSRVNIIWEPYTAP